MDEDIIIGGAKQVAGRVERAAGTLAGDPATEIRGAARVLGGATQRAFGSAKDEVRGAVGDTAGGNSMAPFLAGVGVGLVAGLFLSRR